MASTEEHTHPEESQTGAESSVSASEYEKARILNACEQHDVEKLRVIAIGPGGFLSDQLRSQACKSTNPHLLFAYKELYVSNTELTLQGRYCSALTPIRLPMDLQRLPVPGGGYHDTEMKSKSN
ncbi:hypothetical protein RRF57_000628 [Xylaria bambusicola]|uniref:Uncharacterized protein n=1 Tax=Xylaria bambusicola TaxID=326684 RepID=A0AAN7UCK1_9PEZI